MARPLYFSAPKNTDKIFNHVEFKGISDAKNDILIDQQSFTEANNVYVNEDNTLMSRPPLKLSDNQGWIIDQWFFGDIGIRYSRIEGKIVDGDFIRTDTGDGEFFLYAIRCFTHELENEIQLTASVAIGHDYFPPAKLVQIEDKIYVWWGGSYFFALNTTSGRFENALVYLYFPIHKLVINGIESELEGKNFLTDTYRRRYQYSALSSINFEKLKGRKMSVGMNGINTSGKSNHLYDIEIQSNQNRMLIYPYSSLGSNYHVDIVQTPRATVVLRYSFATRVVEVSFDGKNYRSLPLLDNIVGNPQLTKDGMWVIAFTKTGIGKCRIVASELADFMEPERVMSWEVDPYMKKVIKNGISFSTEEMNASFIPCGYFNTIDQFAYVFKGPSIFSNMVSDIVYIYTEWLSGTNDEVWGFTYVIDSFGTALENILDDNLKVSFRYSPPTIENNNLPCVVTIFNKEHYLLEDTYYPDTVFEFYFERDVDIRTDDFLKDNDYVRVYISDTDYYHGYMTKLTDNGKDISFENNNIVSGDLISFTTMPLTVSIMNDWSSSKDYKINDVVTYHISDMWAQVWRCIKAHTNQTPPAKAFSNDYWVAFTYQTQYGTFGYEPYGYTEPWPAYNGSSGNFVNVRAQLNLKFVYLSSQYTRYIIEKKDGTTGIINKNEPIKLIPFEEQVRYTSGEANNIFGAFPIGYSEDGSFKDATRTWEQFFLGITGEYYITIPKNTSDFIDGKRLVLTALNDTATLMALNENKITYDSSDFVYSDANQIDFYTSAPEVHGDNVIFKTLIAFNLVGNTGRRDQLLELSYNYTTKKQGTRTWTLLRNNAYYDMSEWFRLQPDTKNILTDLYSRIDGSIVEIPSNGALSQVIQDDERLITNDETIAFITPWTQFITNIHKVSADYLNLSNSPIQSGDIIAIKVNAKDTVDYLTPFSFPDGWKSNRFKIEKIAYNENLEWVPKSGPIKKTDFVRLTSVGPFTIPAGHIGNPSSYSALTVNVWNYPNLPGWSMGDPWPTDWSNMGILPPVFAVGDGYIRRWSSEYYDDTLPTGPLKIYGAPYILRRIQPITIASEGVWYSIDGDLWTSEVSADTIIELDEYVNATTVDDLYGEYDDNGNFVQSVNPRWFPLGMTFRGTPPNHQATLDEHYFSYSSLLQITASRRDEQKLFTEEGRDLLLYMPKINEQVFAKPITNLHTLSENEMGIFTQDEIWYVQSTSAGYTKAVKSKIPAGCREGSDITTALDGKLIIFTTPRGVAALSPQDFIATTEQTLTYLSDNIQSLYKSFYNDGVHAAQLMPADFMYKYKPMLKIVTYKYWIIFHRYMDKIVLAFDTRNATWWKWTTPYPIISMATNSRLHFLMHVDFNPVSNLAMKTPIRTLLGVSFIWADQEADNLKYMDDVFVNSLNGYSEWIDKDNRRVIEYAEPMIKWSMTSQRLHFGQINNYKRVKALNMIAKGNSIQTAKLSMKVFRDFYHPEKSEVMEMAINDVRNFSKRMNLMHLMNFQYKLETDVNNTEQSQLKLDTLNIKYEIKEGL